MTEEQPAYCMKAVVCKNRVDMIKYGLMALNCPKADLVLPRGNRVVSSSCVKATIYANTLEAAYALVLVLHRTSEELYSLYDHFGVQILASEELAEEVYQQMLKERL